MAEAPVEARVSPWAWALLAGLTLAALVLRIASLHQSLWGDEGFTWLVTGQDSFRGMIDAVRSDYEVTPPFYFVLAWIFRRFGDSPEMIRAPSVLAGTALVPAVFTLGRRTIGWQAGLLGATLMALSPIAIYYAVEARNYSVLALVLTLSTLTVFRACLPGASRWWWLLFGMLTALALYTHYTSIFVIAAQFLWVIAYRRERWRGLVGAGALAAVLFLPWLPELARDGQAPGSLAIELLYPLTFRSYGRGVVAWLIGLPEASLKVVPGLAALVLVAVAAATTVCVLGSRALRRRTGRPGQGTMLVGFVAVAAPLGVLAASLAGNDIFLPRNLVSSLPCALLLVSAAALALRGKATLVAAVALVCAFVLGAASTFKAAARRPDLRSVAERLDSKARPDALVVDYMSTVLGGGPQLGYVEFQSSRPHRFVYYVPAGGGVDSGFEVVEAVPGKAPRSHPVAGGDLATAASRAARELGYPELFLVVPDFPAFGGRNVVRPVPGYVFEGRTIFPGSIPMILDRYAPAG